MTGDKAARSAGKKLSLMGNAAAILMLLIRGKEWLEMPLCKSVIFTFFLSLNKMQLEPVYFPRMDLLQKDLIDGEAGGETDTQHSHIHRTLLCIYFY